MANYRGVILDIDGTLIDSNDAHAQAWVEALAENGHEVTFENVKRLIGKGSDKLLPEVTGLQKETPAGKKISERRGQIFKERYLPGLQPFPKVPELLRRMREDGLTLAVATSAQRDELEPMLRLIGIENLLDEISSSNEARHTKPDPDIVQSALQKMRLAADQTIMLGDTPYDIEAAAKAGAATIAFRCGGWTDEHLKGALAIYDDPADLLEHYDSSAFGG